MKLREIFFMIGILISCMEAREKDAQSGVNKPIKIEHSSEDLTEKRRSQDLENSEAGPVENHKSEAKGSKVSEESPNLLDGKREKESVGISYIGFGNRELGLDRLDWDPMEADRLRIKPFEVLGSEIERVTGVVPDALDRSESTFSPAVARWYKDAERSSLSTIASFNIAYEASLKMIEANLGEFASPIEDTCRSFIENACSSIASNEQITTCVSMTGQGATLSREQKMAYAFSTILTTTCFMAY